jgi:type II secretory pathway pseudopilin PulG
MAKQFPIFTLKKLLSFQQKRSRCHRTEGFTLLELLVVTVIAGGIVAGLMYTVVELLSADQRESARTETQREMQMALDYMSSELREAVYVYDGRCVEGGSAPTDCKGLLDYIPTELSANGTLPVLAFWKQQPLPSVLRQQCATAQPAGAPFPVPCLSANSFSLVVYALVRNTPGDRVWKGRARIVRYALTEFQQNGSRNTGYVNPLVKRNWGSWPFGTAANTPGEVNLQNIAVEANGVPGRPNANAGQIQVLVDYVDDGTGWSDDQARNGRTPAAPTCPDVVATPVPESVLTPLGSLVSRQGLRPDARSFYACVTPPAADARQEVTLFLRGDAFGRTQLVQGRNSFLPTLRTSVSTRGVLANQ